MRDLLPAYEALICNREQLASCQSANTVAEFLANLKTLWSMEAVSDDHLLSELTRCNRQIIELDAQHLTGRWLPYRYDSRTGGIHWCSPAGHPSEPFHDEYVSKCRQQVLLNQLIQPKTSLASLGTVPVTDQPAGFIFHLSRCGSTLVSGCLSELDETVVLSESQLLTEILLDESLGDAEKARVLPQLIALQGCLYPGRKKIIIKWNAWDIFHWSLLRKLFPQVPVIFLTRNPLEILASHCREAGRHMAGDDSLRAIGLVPERVDGTGNLTDWRIAVLHGLFNEMRDLADHSHVEVIDYDDLNEARIVQLARRMGVVNKRESIANIRCRMKAYSKQLHKVFSADGGEKQAELSNGDRDVAWHRLGAVYQQLIAKAPTELDSEGSVDLLVNEALPKRLSNDLSGFITTK